MEYEIYKNFTSDLLGQYRPPLVTLPTLAGWGPGSPGCRQGPESEIPGHLQIRRGPEGWLGLSGLPVSLGVLYTHMYTAVLLKNPSKL